MEKLPGDYIAGFVDGEGCFTLNFRRDVRHDRPGKPVYFYWSIGFAIVLRKDDIEILKGVQETLGCGKITLTAHGEARYAVTNREDLETRLTPFFEKYLLHAKKKHDFMLWKEAFAILKRNQQEERRKGVKGFQCVNWNTNDLGRLKSIHKEMAVYKSSGKAWKWLQ